MKKVKLHALLGYNALLSVLLTVLGFSSACKQDGDGDEYGPPASEYGTPHATFIVKGQIRSQLDSAVIPNVETVMGNDTAYSDENGNYEVKAGEFPKDQTFLLKFNDVDGPSNGKFSSLDSAVEFKSPAFTDGDGHWNQGKTEKELNVKMKPAHDSR